MGNVTRLMIGNLLTLFTSVAAFGLGAVLLQNLLERRVRALVRVSRRGLETRRDTEGN